MTTAKHTPGPWQVRSGIDGTPRMDSRDGYTVERADPTAGKPFVVSTWSLPNARLIAAAPDLKAFAEKVRDFAREIDDDGLYQAADSVIAKAEGRS